MKRGLTALVPNFQGLKKIVGVRPTESEPVGTLEFGVELIGEVGLARAADSGIHFKLFLQDDFPG